MTAREILSRLKEKYNRGDLPYHTSSKLVYSYDLLWLFEQAEQVEELGKVVDKQSQVILRQDSELDVMEQQNERYREGLKNLYLSICKGGKYDERINKQVAFNIIMDIEKIDDDLRDELNKALESESE